MTAELTVDTQGGQGFFFPSLTCASRKINLHRIARCIWQFCSVKIAAYVGLHESLSPLYLDRLTRPMGCTFWRREYTCVCPWLFNLCHCSYYYCISQVAQYFQFLQTLLAFMDSANFCQGNLHIYEALACPQ